jgi:TonB-dependent receptor
MKNASEWRLKEIWGTPFMSEVRLTAIGRLTIVTALAVAGSGPVWGQQPQPGATTSNASTSDLEEIVVTGIRASLQESQDIKRYAPSVVEAITAVDLGRFSDPSVVDALGRIPGVQIEKTDGPGDIDGGSNTGDRVSIRGLGSQYIQTTINGRPALSMGGPGGELTGSRAFDFDIIPAEILSGVTVYKTATASLYEPGLAGAINVQTLRPLDARRDENYYGSFTAGQTYDDAAKGWGPRYSGILGGKFLDGTLGVLVAGLHSNEVRQQDKIFRYDNYPESINVADASGAVSTLTDVRVPDQVVLQQDRRYYDRNTATADIQWRPNENFEANVDFLHTRYVVGGSYPSLFVGLNDTYGSLPRVFGPGGVEVQNGDLVYLDSSKIIADGAGTGEPGGALASTLVSILRNQYEGGVNLRWNFEPLTITADYGHNYLLAQSDFRNYYSSNDAAVAAEGGIPYLLYNDTTGGAPSFAVGSQFTNPALYAAPGFYAQQNQYLGKVDSFKLDFAWSLSSVGVLRVGASDVESSHDYRTAAAGTANQPAALPGFFTGQTYSLFGINGIPLVSTSAACVATPAICSVSNFNRGSFAGGFPSNPYGSPQDQLPLGNNSGLLHERNLGIYGEFDFKGELFGLATSGNVGLRAVHITEIGIGISGVTFYISPSDLVPSPIHMPFNQLVYDTYSYERYLPSANFTVSPDKQTNIRVGIAKTISLADYSLLFPTSSVQLYDNGATPGATTNNLHLNPTQAWNYDLTFEHYWNYGGAVISSLFYKKVSDFVNVVNVADVPVPGQTVLVNATEAINSQNGYAYGLELGTNQPFTFLPSPWDGFGLQANYTYVESLFSADRAIQGAPSGNFPGASRNNYNGSAYYEKYGFSARVAMTYRSSYVSQLGTLGTSWITDPQREVDASLGYKFNRYVELMFTGSNLTGQDRLSRYESGAFALYSTRPRDYTVAVRGSF